MRETGNDTEYNARIIVTMASEILPWQQSKENRFVVVHREETFWNVSAAKT